MIITDEMVKKICDEFDEIDSLIPESMKQAHKDSILYGEGCFVVDENGITPIGLGAIYKELKGVNNENA
tara:strand:- start:200 stop:406 length:207 start_codon:yes stop_codon:yes gene_type:complete